MAVRTKQLVGVRINVAAANTGVSLYQSGSAETVIVKSVYVWNNTASAARVDLSVRDTANVNLPVDRTVIPSLGLLIMDPCWFVLKPLDIIRVTPQAAGEWRFLISGAELEGVAD